MLELDHLFVMTRPGAPAAERLIERGLVEGSPRVHEGQGTRNRRFFFRNFMLELLWVHDEEEAGAPGTRRTRLLERWAGRDDGASPFGISTRPASQDAPEAPFAAWEYRPPYLPAPLVIQNAEDDALQEPMWFHLPFLSRQDSMPDLAEPLDHPAGLRELGALRLALPREPAWSAAARALIDAGVFEPIASVTPHAELIFDAGRAGADLDLRPELPLRLRW